MKRGKRAAIAAALLLAPALLALGAFALPAQYGATYLAALNDKAAALESASSPKIVMIGGSGCAFDVDCALLETLLPGYQGVNFGLYAGLGTTVMLEMALPNLNPGDAVVFSPELSGQTLSDWFDGESMWQAAEERPDLLGRLHPSRWEKMLSAFPRYAARKTGFALLGSEPEGSGVYARDALTEKGDVKKELRPANQMPGGWDENMPLSFSPAWPDEAFIRRVNDFCRACRQRGVQVFFRFCPMNRAALAEGEEENVALFEERLKEKLDCPVLGDAREALMEAGWFYDTNFHLNGAGAVRNTVFLARELAEALGAEMTAPGELPPMPSAPDGIAWAGEDGDGDCFTYEAGETECRITGLTEAGKEKKEITVPAQYAGKAVTSFDAKTFAGNGNLEALIIQANIRVIPDGAFAGCSRLKTIALLQMEPEKCTVGGGLLAGCGAVITVPAEKYGVYCTNYFWAVHAARLRPMEGGAEKADTEPPPKATASPSLNRITYLGNGGSLRTGQGEQLIREVNYAHLRNNLLQGSVWFQRDGFTLTGWNTRPDGGGEAVGLGSRADASLGDTFYAQWMPWSPEEAFDFSLEKGGAVIAGYHGEEAICVIPQTWRGLPVRAVASGAFREKGFALLVLPPSLSRVEEGAFQDCDIQEMILFDTLEAIADASFLSCRGPETLRINAASAPVYSGSYFDTFSDKYDRLLSLAGQRKLVLSSGSSGRYGYDSAMLERAFPQWRVVNMGVYAFTNALPQLTLMLPLLEEGDTLLYAPEFDAVQEQFCVSNALDASFWAMMESNYDAAAALPLEEFSKVFDSLGEYLSIRKRMPSGGYEVSPANYDDDGQYYPFATYNLYGDFILPRPNGTEDKRLRHNIADYTADSFPPSVTDSLNSVLARFREKGIQVYFSYTPRNSASLTEESTRDQRRALDRLLRERLTVPVISDMEDSLLPGRYFYLIDSHLSTEGAKIRTERIIQDLKNVLNSPL